MALAACKKQMRGQRVGGQRAPTTRARREGNGASSLQASGRLADHWTAPTISSMSPIPIDLVVRVLRAASTDADTRFREFLT